MNISSKNPVTVTGKAIYSSYKIHKVFVSFFEVLRFFWDSHLKSGGNFYIRLTAPGDSAEYLGNYWYIVKDSYGRIFSDYELRKSLKDFHIKDKPKIYRYFTRYRYTTPICEFRRDPVQWSGLGNKASHHRCIHPKTTAEKRDWDKLKLEEKENPEYVIHTRASRASHLLPNSWDDKPRSNYRTKSWKAYRIHQYKAS